GRHRARHPPPSRGRRGGAVDAGRARTRHRRRRGGPAHAPQAGQRAAAAPPARGARWPGAADRKSTRLSSSHEWISYAVFCLKKKKKEKTLSTRTRKGILRRSKGTRAYTTDERGGQV